MLRTIVLPVVEPLGGTWPELWSSLKEMWVLTTQASNWILTELYARDVRRSGDDKMPPMPSLYLYPELRRKFPKLAPKSAVHLEHSTQRKYRAKRYAVVWLSKSTLPTMRYPQPLPVDNQSWSTAFDEGGRPVLSIRIGEKRWELRLKGGARYRRQLAALRVIVEGMAARGEAALYSRVDGTLLSKIVAWLPRPPANERSGSLNVCTRPDSLLVAVDTKGERLWTLNGDHVRRWIAEHDRRLWRLSQDQKAEQRPVPTFAARRQSLVLKYRNRMSTAIQQFASQLANFAKRRKVAIVVLDDSDQSYAEKFPWFELRKRISVKLGELGIEFKHANLPKELIKPNR